MKLKDFRPQRKNANRGTERGSNTLNAIIRQHGVIGAMTVAADGESFDGSKRLNEFLDVFGPDVEPIVVESDGTRPVIHKRIDIPTADDEHAIALGLAANRVAELGLDWDPAQLADYAERAPHLLKMLWGAVEIGDIKAQAALYGRPSAEELEERFGQLNERDLWPEIKIKVSPETMEAYRELMLHAQGEDDDQKFNWILNAALSGV